MRPAVARTEADLRRVVAQARREQQTVGLVPTMGALHAGHASLIRAARAQTDWVVVSIFVNPSQFGPTEDFARYPRPWEADLQLCGREGVDLVFAPDSAAMFPPGFATSVEVQGLQDVLCGASRPGHFRGVATVVLKLFNLVQPEMAYFGQKDAQQVRIIEQLVKDLNVPVQICVCPIVREPDWLALSSRNQYLDPGQRGQAVVLFQALREAVQRIEQGEQKGRVIQQFLSEKVRQAAEAVLDYAAVVDAATLLPIEQLRGEILLALAVKFGATRLIDNIQVSLGDR